VSKSSLFPPDLSRPAIRVGLFVLALSILVVAAAIRPVSLSGAPRVVVIPSGAPSSAIGQILREAGIIRSASDFVLTVRIRGLSHSLQGGEYRLSPTMSLLAVVDVVSRGQVLLHAVTIPEGLTATEVVDVLVDRGLGEREPLTTVVRHGADLYTLAFLDGAVGGSLEGFLLPDTYQVPRGLPARDVVGVFLGRFGRVVVPLWEERGGGRSLREIITMASLVEREARLSDERALIAGVLYNRLHRRMLLEVDATVLYALGRHKSVVTYKDLEVVSPYNTYRHIGLPPGPIANPGVAAIEAALTPAVTDYLYYVARADGSHVFSRTYQEHLAAVRRQRSLP